MACIHTCPQKAIQLKMPEKNPESRYRNENIGLMELIEANEQKSKFK
jgi:ferredoxin